jgi:large subunit ribosomal protein L4
MATETTNLSVDVVDLAGATVGSVDLPAEWFDGKVNIGVMHEVVTAQLAAARQGTHKTKTRGEVRGGGTKPWRQKGTGRARHGSIRSPIWVGGGAAHGRVPKDWSKRVNKKLRRAALRSALTDRARNDVVTVVREFAFATPRTKDAVAALAALGLEDVKVLVVLAARDEATVKSLRNLPTVHVLTVDQLNTYDVLRSDVVVFDEAALVLLGGATASPAAAESESAEPEAATPAAEDTGDADDTTDADEAASTDAATEEA